MPGSAAKQKRPGRVKRMVERLVLGAVMSVCAYLVDRRLRRALKASQTRRRTRPTAHVG
jgi:hypothetical protein